MILAFLYISLKVEVIPVAYAPFDAPIFSFTQLSIKQHCGFSTVVIDLNKVGVSLLELNYNANSGSLTILLSPK